jgi:hypothetical protein
LPAILRWLIALYPYNNPKTKLAIQKRLNIVALGLSSTSLNLIRIEPKEMTLTPRNNKVNAIIFWDKKFIVSLGLNH